MEQIVSPSIFKSPIPEKTGLGNKNDLVGWIKKNIVKIIIALLVTGVALGLAFGVSGLFSSAALPDNFKIPAPGVNALTDATISLIPDKVSYKSGDLVAVKAKLFTGGYTTDSTDLVVKYDPAFLAPEEDTFFALAGDLYSEYPAMQIDRQQGMIGISGITVPGKNSFSGAGIFATLYFTALKDGQTKVSVNFEKGATADSNVVLSGSTKDILGIVKDTDILISETDLQPPQKNNQSCDNFTQGCLDSSGSSGTQKCTGGSIKNGSCGYDSEFTESCEPCQT